MRRMGWFFAALLFLALPIAAAAQAQTGSLTGVVLDEMGAVVPGATITVKPPTGASVNAVTDVSGRYTVSNLAPGAYEVTIELAGFARQVKTVNVASGQAATVDVRLAIAGQAESVQVTGTLIPRPTLEAMTPVTTMSVEELSYQGKTRLEDLLTTLPQIFTSQNSTVSNGSSGTATVNLRNLGPTRTLVLIDGRRMPTGDTGSISPDLNFIPAALVKRVDVLTGGASSVYGADAVAGVVNFILDRDFEGIRAGFSPGGFQHNNNDALSQKINQARGFTAPTGSIWDGGQWDAYGALGGKIGTRGHATAYFDYRKTNAVLKNARDYTNCSISALGPTSVGPRCSGSSTSPTGRFFTDDGGDYTVDPATGNTFTNWGNQYLFNFAPFNYMQRPDRRLAGGGFLNYSWNKYVEGYAETMLMNDTTDAQIAPSGDFGNTLYINCDNPMLSADQYKKICTNAGYGPGIVGPDGVVGHAGLQILRRNVEGGGRIDKLTHTSYRVLGGFRGQMAKGWTYDVYTLQADTRRPETYLNDLNTQRLQDALFVTGNAGDPSSWRCVSGNAGCVPLNYFQKNGVTQAALAYVQLPLVSIGDVKTQLVSGKITADLKNYGVALPTATEGISFAVGSEYRKESLDLQSDLAYQNGWGAGQGGPILPVSGFYSVKDLFAEVVVPMVQDVPGAKDLSFAVGYRYSNYNITGSHPSFKVEGSYAPSADLKVRAGFNRAVRSPNVVELFATQALGLGGSFDPCSGTSPEFSQAQCAKLGVSASQYGRIQPNPAGQYNSIGGGNPLLNPETADATTFGVVISPTRMSGFTTALDFYDIKLKDTVGALNPDDILKQCGLTGDSALCGQIHRDQFGSLWRTPNGYTRATNQNIGSQRTRGLDANINYIYPFGRNTLTLNLIGSYLMKAQINTGLFEYDCVGLTGPICNAPFSNHTAMQPKWRHLFRASWKRDKTTISAAWRMIGKVTAEELSDQPALANAGARDQLVANFADKYDAWHYIDLHASYPVMKGVAATFGVNNVFDKQPPLGSGSTADDYAKGFFGTYDPYGRFVHFSVQLTF